MIIKFKIFENNSNIDRILDKISDKGITSLTDEDKYYLDGSDKNQVFEDFETNQLNLNIRKLMLRFHRLFLFLINLKGIVQDLLFQLI